MSAGVPQRSRVLLTGPSGSGKTTLINYLSLYYSAIHLVVVDLTSLYSPFVGETEKNVVSVFEQVFYVIFCVFLSWVQAVVSYLL